MAMKRKVYCKPELKAMEIQAIQLFAGSGGTPPPSNAPRFDAIVTADIMESDGATNTIDDFEAEDLD